MEALPGFILQEILSYIDDQLQLTCKLWRFLMVPLIYETYTHYLDSPDEMEAGYMELDQYGKLVIKIRRFVTSNLLDGILLRCPYLKSVSLVVHNEDELHQIAESLKTNRTKLTVLELSMYIRFNNFPTSLNSLFSGLSELAIGMEPDGIVTRDFLPEFKSSCLRILRIELSQIHFSFIQSIPERFPQLKHLSIVGRIQAPSINQNRPPAFHNLSLLELELYSDVAIEPIAFLGDKKLNLTTLFISSECMLDHGKVVDLLKTPWPALRSLTLGGASNMRLKDFTPLSRLTHLQLDFSLFNLTPLLGHMFEAMPHLKSIEFTAKISDQGFENLVSVPNLAKVALCGFLDLGFHFISWLFRLPYLQKLLLHSHPGGLFKVEVDPNAFVGVLPSLLVIETPQPPCALSEFLQMHAPNLISVRDSSPDV